MSVTLGLGSVTPRSLGLVLASWFVRSEFSQFSICLVLVGRYPVVCLCFSLLLVCSNLIAIFQVKMAVK